MINLNYSQDRKKDSKALSSCYLGSRSMAEKSYKVREGLSHMDTHYPDLVE